MIGGGRELLVVSIALLYVSRQSAYYSRGNLFSTVTAFAQTLLVAILDKFSGPYLLATQS